LEEKTSPKFVKNVGKIVVENENYFLDVGSVSRGQKYPLGPILASSIQKEMVGEKVELIMSSDIMPSVMGIKFPDRSPVICYMIMETFDKSLVNTNVRIELAKKLLEEKVITEEDYERMV